MKLFDLKFGKTILIFQKEKEWFYYLQLKTELESDDQKGSFIDQIKINKGVGDMIERINE